MSRVSPRGESLNRSEVSFYSGSDKCAAWHFRPAGPRKRACIVMAHGLGAPRTAGLDRYALRFADAGFDVLVFDYRHLGASGGKPRQVLSIGGQLQDWRAAIETARNLHDVDPDRVCLWGTSFSGGHVVVAGSRDRRVAAISAQCPMMDGRAASQLAAKNNGRLFVTGVMWSVIRDLGGELLGLSPLLIPIVGQPGTMALMNAPDAVDGYAALVPTDFRNEAAARIALSMNWYRPFQHIAQVACPMLFQVCDHDSVAPADSAIRATSLAKAPVTVERYPIGHFDIYLGEHFEVAVSRQLRFFERHV